MLTEWALLGQGITLKPAFEVATHLRSGRLVAVLSDFPPEPVTLAVVYPHRKLLPAKVKAFADFMVEECGRAVAAEMMAAQPTCPPTQLASGSVMPLT
jgi:DNA-binding transcriptional LysR family regulator